MSINTDESHQRLTASERDKTPPVWDMSQERAFIENLLGQRFNFFLVFFSIVMAGSVNAKTQLQLQLLLGIGVVICVLFASVLRRSQEKLDIILNDLFTDETHPAKIVDMRARPCGSRRRIIGILIPRICCGILILGFVFSIIGVLKVAK